MKQKKLLFQLIGLFLLQMQFNLQAQEYVPFPDSNTIWSEVFTSQQPYEIETYQYGISGDTVINANQYQKLYLLNDTVYPLITGQYCGAIREDSTKIIFVIDCNCAYPGSGQDEVILYDFSKSIGDTVFVGIDGLGPSGYLVIDYVDSMLIDNSYRKTFHFLGYESYWIEGLGSTRGLFSPIMTQPTGYQKWELICFNQDNEVKYLNPGFNTCFPILTGMNSEELESNDIKIFPHPVTNISVIEFMNNTSFMYQYIDFYNIFGQKVNHINIKDRKQIFIKKIDYRSGLYVYRISGQNIKSVIGKIIIE
jgi:hypothetical protein